MERKPTQPIWLFLGVLLLAAACFAQSLPECEPGPEVHKALDKLPKYRGDPTKTDWQVYQERVASLHALLLQYPNDLFVHRKYIESTSDMRKIDRASSDETGKASAGYSALHARNPEDPQFDYLYGLTLLRHDTPQAIKLFNAALQQNPRFVWPHLALVNAYRSPAFADPDEAVAHEIAFLDACPATLEGYESLGSIKDKNVMATYAAKLRLQLQNQTDSQWLGAYQTLWSIEFKAHPGSEHPALRKQVGDDLARLRRLNLVNSREWYEALSEGYLLVGDQKQAIAINEQRDQHFPKADDLPDRAKWLRDHPMPGPDTSPAARQAFARDLLAQTGHWVTERPKEVLGNFFIMMDGLEAIDSIDDVPAADVERAVDQMLEFAGENGGGSPWLDDYSYAADVLTKRQIAPEKVIEFAERGLAISDLETKQPISDLFGKEGLEREKFSKGFLHLRMMKYEIGAYLQLKQVEKAESLLTQLDLWLQDFKLLVGADSNQNQLYSGWLSDYWTLRARGAELRDRKLDAMSFYENALLTRLDAQIKPPAPVDDLVRDAHRLWTNLNGTEDGWQLWYGRPANDLASKVALTWQKVDEPLPPLELTDLNDQPWSLASLKGKVTFITFWATWCGPCREELSRLQKLADQYKNRSDFQFITFNLDENPGQIQPFLKEHELSLVVIPLSSVLATTLITGGIPQNWIVDQQNVVRMKSIGYEKSQQWATEVQNAIEQVKANGKSQINTTAASGGSPQ